MEKRTILFATKALCNQFHRLMQNTMRASHSDLESLTGMQHAIIRYVLRNNQDCDIYQKNIEQHFNIRRATATGLLQPMEEKGLIERIPCTQDRRMKKIQLTAKALAHFAAAQQDIEQIEQVITNGLSEEEVTHYFSMVDRMIQNVQQIDSAGQTPAK